MAEGYPAGQGLPNHLVVTENLKGPRIPGTLVQLPAVI